MREEDMERRNNNLLVCLVYFCDAMVQLPTSMRGGNGKVAYIDTEGTLYPLFVAILS